MRQLQTQRTKSLSRRSRTELAGLCCDVCPDPVLVGDGIKRIGFVIRRKHLSTDHRLANLAGLEGLDDYCCIFCEWVTDY